jgi:hypothetical protein
MCNKSNQKVENLAVAVVVQLRESLDEMPYKGGHGPLLFIDLSSSGGGG